MTPAFAACVTDVPVMTVLLGVCPPLARPSSARTGCRCWLLSQKGGRSPHTPKGGSGESGRGHVALQLQASGATHSLAGLAPTCRRGRASGTIGRDLSYAIPFGYRRQSPPLTTGQSKTLDTCVAQAKGDRRACAHTSARDRHASASESEIARTNGRSVLQRTAEA